jgi:large subunit ribosomal protein L2
MGKRIISQARGKGGPTYRVRRKAYSHKIKYPMQEGEAQVLKIFHSAGHTAPLMKIKINDEIFFNPAFNGAFEGQKTFIGVNEKGDGSVSVLKNIPTGTRVYNVELNPGDGGKIMRAGGASALVYKKYEGNKISILTPKKKEIKLSGDCRATIGVVAGSGRVLKPFMKAGTKSYKMRARNKLYPNISAVSVNALDHPFGSGRGKRIKSKIAKRNAPSGRRVGHIRPRRTGRKKR